MNVRRIKHQKSFEIICFSTFTLGYSERILNSPSSRIFPLRTKAPRDYATTLYSRKWHCCRWLLCVQSPCRPSPACWARVKGFDSARDPKIITWTPLTFEYTHGKRMRIRPANELRLRQRRLVLCLSVLLKLLQLLLRRITFDCGNICRLIRWRCVAGRNRSATVAGWLCWNVICWSYWHFNNSRWIYKGNVIISFNNHHDLPDENWQIIGRKTKNPTQACETFGNFDETWDSQNYPTPLHYSNL